MDISELSAKIAKESEDISTQAKNLFHIMICGSYQDNEDAILEELRDRIRTELGIPGIFLMKDVPTEKDVLYSQKFQLIWKIMKKGDNIPFFILYAGKSATKSLGLNAEIHDIAKDEEMLNCTHLFMMPNIELVEYARFLKHKHTIQTKEEFFNSSLRVVKEELERSISFLTFKRMEKYKNPYPYKDIEGDN